MKKFLLAVLIIVVIVVCYLLYKEYSFSPLNKKDFQKLFKGDNISFDKSCSQDFIGASVHGELFEFYKYKIKGVTIDKDYPRITAWENKKITNPTAIGRWKNCPIDSQTTALYQSSILSSMNLENVKCGSSFKKDIINPNNYYSYVYFSESEEYFLLYCTDRQELYYIRLNL